MKNPQSVLIIFLFFLTTGCSFFSPVKTTPETTYLISAVPHYVPVKRRRAANIMVTVPESVGAFNTTQMAFQSRPYEIAYYGLNRWIDTPGQMLQPLLVRTLQKTGHYHAVLTPSSPGRYQYILNTQIQELIQDYTRPRAFVRIRVQAQLVRASSLRVLGTKQIKVTVPIQLKTPYAGVIATNQATKILLTKIILFTLKKS